MRINKIDQNREKKKQTWKYNVNTGEIETKNMSKKWKQEYLKVKIIKTIKTEIEDRNIEEEKQNKNTYYKGQINGNQEQEHNSYNSLTRKECSAIFSARTRMLNVIGNYHNRNSLHRPNMQSMWQQNGNTGTYTRRMPSSHG